VVMMILGILTFLSVNMFKSEDARNHLSKTDDRLELITAKIKQYYEIHQQLPVHDPDGTQTDEIPVQVNGLDMEQKYRFDAWGQYLKYDPGDVSDIQDVGGVAASIVSGGPDQNIDTKEDNITIFINVMVEAKFITLKKLKVLGEKVAAYDALFAGVDNNGNKEVDDILSIGDAAELTGDASAPVNFNTCPPTNSFNNDPSGGFATLDAIEDCTLEDIEDCKGVVNYNCPAPLINHIVSFYGLPSGLPGGYDLDPWNHYYKWGYEGRRLIPDDDTTKITPSDRRYHRFYSSGPDEDVIQDDITFAGQ